MKDPTFGKIIFEIEKVIHRFDREYEVDGVRKFKDSDVKSAIRKALGRLKGKKAGGSPKNEGDQWKAKLADELVRLSLRLCEEESHPRAVLGQSLLAVEDSLKTRREMGGHSRGYLDFLEDFLHEADAGAGF